MADRRTQKPTEDFFIISVYFLVVVFLSLEEDNFYFSSNQEQCLSTKNINFTIVPVFIFSQFADKPVFCAVRKTITPYIIIFFSFHILSNLFSISQYFFGISSLKTSTRNTIELLCFIQCDTKMREPRTIKTTKQNIVCTQFMCVRTFLFFYCFMQVPFTIYTVLVKVYCAAIIIIIIKFFVQFFLYIFVCVVFFIEFVCE